MFRVQVYRKPKIVVGLLGIYTGLFLYLGYLSNAGIIVIFAFLYSIAFMVSIFSLSKIYLKEKTIYLNRHEKILIVAPHQDDCAICAGGFGLRNLQLGGETHIAYVANESTPHLTETRTAEAEESWRLSGAPRFYHMNLLPNIFERDPENS